MSWVMSHFDTHAMFHYKKRSSLCGHGLYVSVSIFSACKRLIEKWTVMPPIDFTVDLSSSSVNCNNVAFMFIENEPHGICQWLSKLGSGTPRGLWSIARGYDLWSFAVGETTNRKWQLAHRCRKGKAQTYSQRFGHTFNLIQWFFFLVIT